MKELASLTLLVPVYNYAGGIAQTLHRLASWCAEQDRLTVRVIFSDDGSTDETVELIRTFVQSRRLSWVVLTAERNRGKGEALRRGLEATYRDVTDFIVFTDCDLHYGLRIITERIIPKLHVADIVIADRSVNRSLSSEPPMRRIASGIFNRLVALLTGTIIRDTQAGLKGFRAEDCRPLFEVLRLSGFAFDVELLSVAQYHRYRIEQVPIEFSSDKGDSASSVVLVPASLSMVLGLLLINLNWKAGKYFSASLHERLRKNVYTIRDR